MAFENLSERERLVLRSLINHYITTAEPVGSRAVAQKYRLGISPATVRSTMQDLEEMGLITHPHTSAGRVPTDKGYRLYVDSMMGPEALTASEEDRIRREICADYAAVEDILEQTATVLATVSKQLVVTIAPRFDKGVLNSVNLIPVAEKKILVILAVKHGLVRTVLLEAESSVDVKSLEKTADVLNEKLSGLTLGEIKESIDLRLKETSPADARLIKLFLDSTDSLLDFTEPDQMHLGGTTNIVDQPEFRDREKLRSLIEVLEEKKLLAELVSAKGIKEGISITIGKEMERGEMQSCSLVTSPYRAGKVRGTIGIIGPTRMRYSKLASMVEYAAKLLSDVLSR
ncbi:MAG: heat-inducible transcription repressor HrcA [Candidatus Zixiibacteriota bacterium]|nr:MAG: heat-inducible transcription repressor HrcA [candidate division Zixibacteria bacterium]